MSSVGDRVYLQSACSGQSLVFARVLSHPVLYIRLIRHGINFVAISAIPSSGLGMALYCTIQLRLITEHTSPVKS